MLADVDLEKPSLENMPANLYESVCVPDLFLGYQAGSGGGGSSSDSSKSPAPPGSNSAAGPQAQGSMSAAPSPVGPVPPALPLPPRQFHDGEYKFMPNIPMLSCALVRYTGISV